MSNDAQLIADIVERLQNEFKFKGKPGSKNIRGNCPSCGKDEAFTERERPWVVFCGRANNCGETHTARELFPDLFENFSKRFPTTPDDPYATARAYLSQDRRFSLNVISGAWIQGAVTLNDGSTAPTVRFRLWENHYWERIIDKSAIAKLPRNKNGKSLFSPGCAYSGKGWMVPKQTINDGDRVYIVEGIFHAIALCLNGEKAIAAFSSNNLPTDIITKNKDKKITWVLAYDNDVAGIKAAKKWQKQLEELNQRTSIAFAPSKHCDWDDCHRKNLFASDKFWDECNYRGRLKTAETAQEYAYHYYCQKRRGYALLTFNNALWLMQAKNVADELNKDDENTDPFTDTGRRIFDSKAQVKKISNCLPEFLHQERDDIMGDKFYVIRVSYEHNHAPEIIKFEGSNLDSPSSFNKCLLNRSAGGKFNGEKQELDILLDRWFKQIKTIHSQPYIGYNADHKVYVYQSFAVHNGKVYELNDEGYFDLGRIGVNTSMKSPAITYGTEFNPAWLNDLYAAFGANGLITLAFWTATLFVQQIRRAHKSFPFLEVTGEPGAGKSTLIETLWHLVGRDYEGFDPQKATKAGIRRAFNQVSNLPVVLIEGDHAMGPDAKQKGFTFDSIKPLYDGRGTGTLGLAKRGNDTEEPMFNGSIMIAQNASVVGEEALMERIVHLDFKAAATNTRENAMRLRNAPLDDMAAYLPHTLKQEKAYLDLYLHLVDQYDARFRSHEGVSSIKQRLIFNHAQLAAAVQCLQVVLPNVTDDMVKECFDKLLERLEIRHNRLSGDSALMEQFWEIFHYIDEYKPADGQDQGKPLLNHHKEPDHHIAVNLNHFTEMCRRFNQPILDQAELKRQMPLSRTYRFVTSKKYHSQLEKRSLNCWIFDRNRS